MGERQAHSAASPIRAIFTEDTFAEKLSWVTLSWQYPTRGLYAQSFDFPGDVQGASAWFSDLLEQKIIVHYSPEGFPDDAVANGPTIISTASLEVVCDLFQGVDLDEARRRFRTTLEIDGVPAFWEDQLFGEEERSAVRFRIGEVNFEGSNPCARCPVPARDPRTGEIIPGFQKRFSDFRRANLPGWTPKSRFDHFYRLATNTRVASCEAGCPEAQGLETKSALPESRSTGKETCSWTMSHLPLNLRKTSVTRTTKSARLPSFRVK